MPDSDTDSDPSELRRRALSRWDDEGGAIASATYTDVPDMTNAELVELRIASSRSKT